MTKPPAQSDATSTRQARRHFVAALTVYGLWLGFLVVLAVRASEPPPPEPEPPAQVETEPNAEA